MKPVLVIGGAHIDRNGTMNAPYMKGSSIPGKMAEDIGGGAFNVASNLARLNIPVTFCSPRADDTLTHKIKERMKNLQEFDDFPINVQGSPPSYTAIKDSDGELIAALADMQLYDELIVGDFLRSELLERVKNAESLVTDANLPEEILSAIVMRISADCLWFAVGTSPAKVEKFLPSLKRIDFISMNMNEAKTLSSLNEVSETNIIKQLKQLGLKSGILTDGPKGLHYFSQENKIIGMPPFPAEKIIDVTGAGDATLSGFIAATMKGTSVDTALTTALAAAKLTIEVKGACNEHLSEQAIEALIAAY